MDLSDYQKPIRITKQYFDWNFFNKKAWRRNKENHLKHYHKLSYKTNSESGYCNLRVCDIGVKTNFSSYDLLILLIPHLLR